MNKPLAILLGLILLVVPIYAWIVDFAGFGTAALSVLQGGVVWLLILIGLVFLLSGISGLKS